MGQTPISAQHSWTVFLENGQYVQNSVARRWLLKFCPFFLVLFMHECYGNVTKLRDHWCFGETFICHFYIEHKFRWGWKPKLFWERKEKEKKPGNNLFALAGGSGVRPVSSEIKTRSVPLGLVLVKYEHWSCWKSPVELAVVALRVEIVIVVHI